MESSYGRKSRLGARNRGVLVFLLLAASLLLSFVAAALDMGGVVVERCQECHGMDKTCQAGTDDLQWWRDTVHRMIVYRSDVLGPEDAETAVRFLADREKRAAICPGN